MLYLATLLGEYDENFENFPCSIRVKLVTHSASAIVLFVRIELSDFFATFAERAGERAENVVQQLATFLAGRSKAFSLPSSSCDVTRGCE